MRFLEPLLLPVSRLLPLATAIVLTVALPLQARGAEPGAVRTVAENAIDGTSASESTPTETAEQTWAESSVQASVETPSQTFADAPTDTSPDTPEDLSADARVDTPADESPDTREDTPAGTPLDIPSDTPSAPAADFAQDGPSPDDAEGVLTPPVPIGPVEIPMPPDAPALEGPITVRVLLQIDEEGDVASVTLDEGAGPPWDEAVLLGATTFRFEPATWNGEPVAVEVPFEQTFRPLPPSAAVEESEPMATLFGTVVEMGTRRELPSATIEATIGDRSFRVETSSEGTFHLSVPAGMASVEVHAPGYKRFLVRENLEEGKSVHVRYLIERQSYDPFEQTVIGQAERQEVARTSLRGRELTRIPGTFGDPFRVVGTLPGVSQVFSLVSYPIVRGAAPGSTGILLDGVRIPQLYHYLAGPAVIHPEFIDRVDFYPGTFPLSYGGYTGGIIDGITRRARPDEERTEIGIDLTNTSLLLRRPVLGMNVTAAGRYGYPGMLLSAFSEDAYASYWDYQARVDGGSSGSRWTVFAFGSNDEAGSIQGGKEIPALRLQFHRLDLKYQLGDERRFDRFQITFGTDVIFNDAAEFDSKPATTFEVHPRAVFRRPLGKDIALHTGIESAYHRTPYQFSKFDSGVDEDTNNLKLGDEARQISVGAFFETPWWATENFLITPGLRFDVWENRSAREASVDPRLTVRYRFAQNEDAEYWLKAGIGSYHQPPRPPLPIPGLSELGLSLGLPASTQSSLGTEIELASGYHFDVQTYFNYMDPIFLDLPPNDVPDDFDYFEGGVGRSYGLEVMLRKRERGNVFGWISYTLSKSERRLGGNWERFSFDRPHMLHLVGGLRLPRDWELGGRFQVQSGRPVSAPGESIRRANAFTRFDLRIDRRAVYRNWMLDFYIDLINVMLAPEAVGEGDNTGVRYILPTVGFRGVL